MKSYERCLQGDFQHVIVLERMYEELRRRPQRSKELPPEEVDDGDDEIGDSEAEDGEKGGEAMEVEVPRKNNEPILDEEGFQLVQGKGRRKRI